MCDKLTIWGDSISCGMTFDESKARYTLCRDTYVKALPLQGVTVNSYAKPGCTAVMGLEIAEKTEPMAGGAALIEFGGNDSDLKWAEVAARPDIPHHALVSLPAFEAALKKLIYRARALGMRPIVALPLPVACERYFNWITRSLDREAILRYLGAPDYIYRWQERYAYAAQRVAERERCLTFDMRGLFLDCRNFESYMSLDGIHPSPKGYAVIRDAFLEVWKAQ